MRSHIKVLLMVLMILPSTLFGADINILNLRVEYSKTPLGIDVVQPRFSWQMQDLERSRGSRQVAYQLVVKDEWGRLVWNSGKVDSDISLNIGYNGKPLLATTKYDWTVNVWDQNGKKHTEKSWFETGLMDPNPGSEAWSGAKWIGGGEEDMIMYAPYLPVFKINYTLQLDQSSRTTSAAFIYGANDLRLMDRYKNLYKLENKEDESYISIELDIAPLDSGEDARLNIYRVGYHPDDRKDTPFKSYVISSGLINEQNKFDEHIIRLSSNLGFTQIHIDGKGKENMVTEVNLNPLGQGGDFIAFPVVGDIGFSIPKGEKAAFSDLEIRHFRSPSNMIFTEDLTEQAYEGIFSEATDELKINQGKYVISGGKSGSFITAEPGGNSMPMLRTAFSASSSKIAKARLYVSARGIYDVYLNGQRIGDAYFNPGSTQYNKTHLYQTFDVTQYISPGKNALGAVLGEGWWSGASTFLGENWNFYGDRQSLLAKLVITYADGTEDIVVSDPESWSYFAEGPLVYGSFFQGEVYNVLKEEEIKAWTSPSYNASGWKSAKEVSLRGNVSPVWTSDNSEDSLEKEFSLIGQFGNTVEKVKELTAKSVEEVHPGVFVYDMGQNMVGVPQISLPAMEPGKKIILRYAEVRYPDLPAYKGNVGMLMLENIRAAMAQDIFISKGEKDTIAPRFTFHGYRYIEITGIDKALPLESVKGTVISSIHELASDFETSNPKVNKLWKNITWSTFGNFLSIPTDCPQRNERLGWSGDISVFARTATYLADVPQFLRRHIRAMRDLQNEEGRFPDVAPIGVGFGGLLWGSAGISVAWESYQQYDDKVLLAEHYEAMKKYIEFVLNNSIDPQSNLIVQNRAWYDLGDWLGPEQGKNDNSLLWEAYLIYDLEMMKKIASVLEKKEDQEKFQKLYQERKDFFMETYVDKESKKTINSGFSSQKGTLVDTQASYVLPLAFDIFPPKYRDDIIDNFVATVERKNMADNGKLCPANSLMTGFIGTSWINKALSDSGNSEVAYNLLQQTSYPSWLYPVEQGATTIWERLDSYTQEDGFGGNNRMNSFNHYSFGAVGAWMYANILGIARDEDSPGFKHFILKPEPDPTGKMTYAKGYYDSMYGRIKSSWERKEGNYYYHFVVPANTSATLKLSAPKVNLVLENAQPLQSAIGVMFLGSEKGKQVFEIQSGEYHILVKE